MDRQAKLARLSALRGRLPHISHVALAAVLREAKAAPLPDLSDRGHVREARDAMALQMTPYGPLCQTVELLGKDGNMVKIEIQHPFAMLFLCSKLRHFSDLLQRTIANNRPSIGEPWALCIYSDEASPGNKLKADNRRKMQCMYWSFLDFGPNNLAKEDFWMVFTCVRSTVINKIQGGMSALYSICLKTFFNTAGFNMMTAGVRVFMRDETELRIFASFRANLADESGLHLSWLCKGASGIKPCVECQNIVSKDFAIEHDLPDDHVLKPFNKVCRPSQLVLHNKLTIQCIMDDLQASQPPVMGKGAFEEKESRLGFTYNAGSILVDPVLRGIIDPSEQNVYDWAHSVLQGVFKVHVAAFVRDLFPIVKYALMHEYLQMWTWPRRLEGRAATGKESMNEKRAASSWEAKTFKVQCSEALSMYPVLAHWISKVLLPSGAVPLDKCECFLRLADVIDLLLATQRGTVTADVLETTIVGYLESFAAAHGNDIWIIKFHHMLHFIKYLRAFGFLPNCIALERKHKTVMRFADAIDNETSYDRSALREVTCRALYVLEHGDHLRLGLGLIKPRKPSATMVQWLHQTWGADEEYLCADIARYNDFECCSKRDVIAIREGDRWVAGQVWCHVSVSGVVLSCVSIFEVVERHEHWSTWRDVDDSAVIRLSDIIGTFIYSMDTPRVTLIHPSHLRM